MSDNYKRVNDRRYWADQHFDAVRKKSPDQDMILREWVRLAVPHMEKNPNPRDVRLPNKTGVDPRLKGKK